MSLRALLKLKKINLQEQANLKAESKDLDTLL